MYNRVDIIHPGRRGEKIWNQGAIKTCNTHFSHFVLPFWNGECFTTTALQPTAITTTSAGNFLRSSTSRFLFFARPESPACLCIF